MGIIGHHGWMCELPSQHLRTRKRSEWVNSKDQSSPIKLTTSKTNGWIYGTTPEREKIENRTSARRYLWKNIQRKNIYVKGPLCKLWESLETANKEQDSSFYQWFDKICNSKYNTCLWGKIHVEKQFWVTPIGIREKLNVKAQKIPHFGQ